MGQHLALWPTLAFQEWEGRKEARERQVPVISAIPQLPACPPVLASTPPTLSLFQSPAHPGPLKGDQHNLWIQSQIDISILAWKAANRMNQWGLGNLLMTPMLRLKAKELQNVSLPCPLNATSSPKWLFSIHHSSG